MKNFGLSPIKADSSVFTSSDKTLIIALYVDDLLIFSSESKRIRELKDYLLGNASLTLSINITRDRENG